MAEDRDLHLLVGRIDGKVDAQSGRITGLERTLGEVRVENRQDHTKVSGLLTEIRDELVKKADNSRVDALDSRIDQLERDGDEDGARRRFGEKLLRGAAAVAGLLVAYLAGAGHP